MNIFINTLIITLICIFIIDLSGVIEHIKRFVSKRLTNGTISTTDFQMKPFDCSLCASFWSNLIYLICINSLSIPMIGWICLLAYSTNWLKDIILTIDSIINKLLSKI